MQEYLRFAPQNDVIFILFVIIFAVICGLKYIFPQQYASMFSLPQFSEIRDNSPLYPILSYLLFTLLLSIILYTQTDATAYPGINSHALPWIFAGGILLYFLLKNFVQAILLGILGEWSKYNSILHLKSWVKTWRIIGLFLLGLLLVYSPFRTDILIIITTAFLLIMMLLEFIILYRTHIKTVSFNNYYFILYLCALEILPILVVFHFWRDWYF
ncbi:MAG: DUF4271 domain-containing protein [Weeksellaceae bacterium]|nr:DUF4271 domain-containing protein [Weeksellaceae bacterium]